MPAALSVDALHWGPAPDRLILHDISFAVAPGQTVALVGPNGAGKSSLLRCLYRFHRPVRGAVRLDGADIWGLKPRQCARRVAAVLQELPADFGLTVREIVALGRAPHAQGWAGTAGADHDQITTALARMELTHLAGRAFGPLSGGEKQRVMIARALVQAPDLLILDEPTNHLDIRHQLDVLAMLEGLDATIVICLHDLALASAHADRVLVLEDGHLVADDAPARALTPHRIRSTFGVEAAIDAHPVTGRPRFSFHRSLGD